MGSCHSKGSRTYAARGRTIGEGTNSKSVLKDGETVYATFEPSKTVKEGDQFNIGVAKSANGNYRYTGYIPSVDSVAIDKSSIEYKRELRNYNVNAQFKADGTVEVTKGGLFTKRRTFKTIDAFEKETSAKLNGSMDYWQKTLDRSAEGYIAEATAQKWKTEMSRTFASPTTKRKYQSEIINGMKYPKMRIAAAQDMKSRLAVAISQAKSKLSK